MKEYKQMWARYVDFSGRSTVREYWMAVLFNFIISFVLGLIVGIIPILSFLTGLYSLAALVPGLALCIRRLKDAGKEWYWIFIGLIPLVGTIILIIMLCKPSVAE